MIIALPSDPTSSTMYLDWVLAYDPGAAATARELLEVVRAGRARAVSKPGRFLDDLERRAGRLPAAHLPWFWDTVGHRLTGSLPKPAGRAYALARKAERDGTLPIDGEQRRNNALLFARTGALPARELTEHQRWLAATLPPARAHTEFVRFLLAWAGSPGDYPGDLATLIRSSARAAGLGPDEQARLLGDLLCRARGKVVPHAVLNAAVALLTKHPQGDRVNADLLNLFPKASAGAAPWLRLLLRCGAAEAVAAERITAEGGLAAWLSRYIWEYSEHRAWGGFVRWPMPPELFELLAISAPLIRRSGDVVRLHQTRQHDHAMDADLLDACLAEGIEVADPGDGVRLEVWGEKSVRDLKTLAEHPVFGPRLEATVHARRQRDRAVGSAITVLPGNEGITSEVLARVNGLLDTVRSGGLGAAHEAIDELASVLDRPTITALDGIEETLAALDLTGPLARTLRAGLPEELSWPALEEAVAELTAPQITAVTCTWPVLTVYSHNRAIAVDQQGQRGSCSFRIPKEGLRHTVHYVDGRFLVAWEITTGRRSSAHAIWADAPDNVFEPADGDGLTPYAGGSFGGFGFQFETPDRGGRYDGDRVLRAGEQTGMACRHVLQMSDGEHVWSAPIRTGNWARLDPVSGTRTTDAALPEFPGGAAPAGTVLVPEPLSLAPMPTGAAQSPLGQAGSLVGCRVLFRAGSDDSSPGGAGADHGEFLLTSIDGRTATLRGRRHRPPWGILRMPEGGADTVVVESLDCRVHAAEDGSLLWPVRSLPSGHDTWADPSPIAAPQMFPPPAYWHFLTPRDRRSSAALRAASDRTVLELLGADPGDLEIPGVTDPGIASGVRRVVAWALDVLRRRVALSRRVGVVRSGPGVTVNDPVSDTDLTAGLRGLLDDSRIFRDHPARPLPATITAVAADGAYLRGAIDDETRRLALPAPSAEWPVLVGSIDAVAWRAMVSTTAPPERAALSALLRTWIEQPFADQGGVWRTGWASAAALADHQAGGWRVAFGPEPEPGLGVLSGGHRPFVQPAADPAPAEANHPRTVTIARDDAARLRRLVELLAQHGPVPLTEQSVVAFSQRTGVRRALAALALGGLPRGAASDDHDKLLRSVPYQASGVVARDYLDVYYRLGPEGRLAVLAAGLPDDPAELWAPGGLTAAAERMAEVWIGRLGQVPHLDEALASDLETDLGVVGALAHQVVTGASFVDRDTRFVLTIREMGRVDLRREEPDGAPGPYLYQPPHRAPASALAWALTERPVGDPLVAWAPGLYLRLRELLDCPGYLVPQEGRGDLSDAVSADPSAKPYAGRVVSLTDSDWQDVTASGLFDNGSYVVAANRYAGAFARASTPGPAEVYTPDGGLARMVQRAASTPVPPGGYEANPLLSVPDLVREAASALQVGEAAATLYLQLLALARPTDRRVREWNGWSAARHKAVQAELADAGAIDVAKRARAGRTAFIPGPWTEPKSPHLPLETAKLDWYRASITRRKSMDGPFRRLLAPLPLHELFERAWSTSRRCPATPDR